MKKHFKKTSTFAGLRGEAFEFKTCALLFSRAMNCKYHFKMASSAEGYGDFDDIIFNFFTPKKYCLFLQLKNKANAKIRADNLVSVKHDFSIPKLYHSYMDIKKKINMHIKKKMNSEESEFPFDVELENCIFILYTNANIEESLMSKQEFEIGTERIALTDQSMLRLDESDHSEIFEKLSELSDLREFLKSFRIMYNQASDNKLDDLISYEIQQYLQLSESDSQIAFTTFRDLIQQWWQKLKTSAYLTDSYEEHSILKKTLEHVRSIQISSLSDQHKLEVSKLNLKFTDNALKQMEVVIENNVTLILTPKSSILVTVAKLYQLMNESSEFLVMKFQDLEERKMEILTAWANKKFQLMIIQIENISKKFDSICTEILHSIENCTQKRLIFIMEAANDKGIKKLKTIFEKQIFKTPLPLQFDSSEFSDFVDESRSAFLDKLVNFQGQEIPLNAIGLDTLNWLDELPLTLLVHGKRLEIGKPLPFAVYYYIERTLESQRIVNSNILRENNTVFAFSGATLLELQSIVPPREEVCYFLDRNQKLSSRFILIDNADEFKMLCMGTNNIHWFQKDGKKLIWKKSYGNRDIIIQNLNMKNTLSWKPSSLLDGDERVIVITAEPGMGKSTLLTHLSKAAKSFYPGTWIVRVNINDFTKLLNSFKQNGLQENDTLTLLENAAYINRSESCTFEKELFHYSFNVTGNMVVLMDGIDEVMPHYSEEIFQILKNILKSKIKKLWMTSRPFMKHQLEQMFEVQSYSLIPFNKEHQKDFLVNFWKKNSYNMDTTTLISFAGHIQELTDKFLGSSSSSAFMGIPLQILLLAEIFEERLKDIDSTKNIVQDINIVSLYDSYIDRKWIVCNEEKMNTDLTKVYNRKCNNILKQKFIQDNMFAGLATLFSKEELSFLSDDQIQINAESYLEEISKDGDMTGLIVKASNEKAQFVHRPTAEYFSAKWFFEHFQENKQFLIKFIFNDVYKVVRRFLDCFLAKDTPLQMSILNGNLMEIIKLDKRNEIENSVNKTDLAGRTALHLAVIYEMPDETRVLLQFGANEKIIDDLLKWTPLDYIQNMKTLVSEDKGVTLIDFTEVSAEIMEAKPETIELWMGSHVEDTEYSYPFIAVKRGLIKLLNYCVQTGTTVNPTDEFENSLLHEACRYGHIKIIEELFSLGAKPDVVDGREGDTSLHIAARFGHCEVVELLLSKGVDIDYKNYCHSTALHEAVISNENEIVFLLLNNNAKVDIKDSCSYTPLLRACASGNIEIVKLLLKKGANVNISTSSHKTPLIVAAEEGNMELAELLLENGANVNTVEKKSYSPLFAAAEKGHIGLCKLFLSYGIDIDVRHEFKIGYTPLTIAAQKGHLQVVDFLHSNGSNLNTECYKGQTPLSSAAEGRHLEITTFLLENGVNVNNKSYNPFSAVAYEGYLDIMKLLLSYGADINLVDNFFGTALNAAANKGETETVNFLLSKGANMHITDNEGRSALHALASFWNTIPCISSFEDCQHVQVGIILIDKGIDINAQDSKGHTPLHLATYHNHLQVVRLLLLSGALVNVADKDGITPLIVATVKRHTEVTKLLLLMVLMLML
ncbi:hypothetical protein C0J52_24502 [Blattella germanica]|nr:hypothetical protein C0J52_24502 [Blattella germanica]